MINKIKLNAFSKNLVILSKPHILFGFLEKPFKFMANTISLSRWISNQDKIEFNDYFTFKRNHNKRYELYQFIHNKYNLEFKDINYYEFGVSGGDSFKWWVNNIKNENSRFFGFDTFEGLPENWGFFKKGDMANLIPSIDDNRVKFVKGLFQETLFDFIDNNNFDKSKPKIIHLDADIFSATLFVLTSIAKRLNKGDILFFDEYNVPNHEYSAFKIFRESFYIDFELIGAVNNYYQVAFMVK